MILILRVYGTKILQSNRRLGILDVGIPIATKKTGRRDLDKPDRQAVVSMSPRIKHTSTFFLPYLSDLSECIDRLMRLTIEDSKKHHVNYADSVGLKNFDNSKNDNCSF